jgi:hypothetical protein
MRPNRSAIRSNVAVAFLSILAVSSVGLAALELAAGASQTLAASVQRTDARAREIVARFAKIAGTGRHARAGGSISLSGTLDIGAGRKDPYLFRCRFPDAYQVAYVLVPQDPRMGISQRVFTAHDRTGWVAGRVPSVEEPYLPPGAPAPADLQAVMGRREAVAIALGVAPDWLLANRTITMTYVGPGSYAGLATDEVSVADADGAFAVLAFDAHSGLPVRLTFRYVNLIPRRAAMDRGIGFEDYRSSGGVLLPSRINSYVLPEQPMKVTGTISFDQVRVDSAMPPDWFTKPPDSRFPEGLLPQPRK